MVVVVYRNRAGGAAPAELQKFIKRQEVKFVDNKKYRNNCLFDALSFISLPDEPTKRRPTDSRVAEGKHFDEATSLLNTSCEDVQAKTPTTSAEKQIQPKLNSKGNRIHRKKEDNVKDEKFDNYFLDFVIKPSIKNENKVKRKLLEIQTENMIKTILPHADDGNAGDSCNAGDSFIFEAIGEKLKDCLDKLGDPAKTQEIKQPKIHSGSHFICSCSVVSL
ncbi:MAG: hypothetical protein EZS28_047852 [Streblomastix strix]|uniref:Uncharacterized protein n=1 Tax=Streblomastix strix TaxID=222440 RepID=A0A5J4TGC5_9EUKA|nr:MAG: hypothetical protein EZS28_047852 [Streblomastix strix]